MTLFAIFLGLYFAFVSAYLSIVLLRLLRQNGRAIRDLSTLMREQGEKLSILMREQGEKLSILIKEGHKELSEGQKTIAKILERIEMRLPKTR